MWLVLSGLGGCGFGVWWVWLVDGFSWFWCLGFKLLFAWLFVLVYLLSYRRGWVVCFVCLGIVTRDSVFGLFCVGVFSCVLFVCVCFCFCWFGFSLAGLCVCFLVLVLGFG